jgi:hypothetical protein
VTQGGAIQIRFLDHATEKWSKTVTVDDLRPDFGIEAGDDHNAPSLLILPSGRILIFYAVHDKQDNLFVKISGQNEDISTWSVRQPITQAPSKTSFNYPQAKLLPSGRIVLFVRAGIWSSGREVFLTSDDSGATWSAPKTVVDFGTGVGIYALVTAQGKTLTMVWSRRITSGRPSNLYYARSRDGGATWESSSGKRLALPLTNANAEAIIRSTEPLFVWDVAVDATGRTAAVYAIGTGARFRYGYASSIGHGWTAETVTTSRLLYGGSNYYAGGIVIDPNNIRRVALSKWRKTLELETWRRTANGWQRERAITSNSGRDNFRPQFVSGDSGGRLVWNAGRYDGLVGKHWTGFSRVNVVTAAGK